MKNFLSIADCSKEYLDSIIALAKHYKQFGSKNIQDKNLIGKIFVNIFFESSTRTRTSFDFAAKNLGMKVINVDVATSSVNKGESLTDTILAVSNMRPAIIAIRHSCPNIISVVMDKLKCPIINAGDGTNEHPTQALQDLFLIEQKFGRRNNLKIAICGDFVHSRVAHSCISLFKKFDCAVSVISPKTTLTANYADWLKTFFDIEVCDEISSGLRGVDVVMALRVQKERMTSCYISSEVDYYNKYGISERYLYFAPHSKLFHPGPVNRNVDIEFNIVDNKKKSLIYDQVLSGVCIRQSIISHLLKGD